MATSSIFIANVLSMRSVPPTDKILQVCFQASRQVGGKAGSKNKIFTTNSITFVAAGLKGAAYLVPRLQQQQLTAFYDFYTCVLYIIVLKNLENIIMNMQLNLITVLISTIFIRISGKYCCIKQLAKNFLKKNNKYLSKNCAYGRCIVLHKHINIA